MVGFGGEGYWHIYIISISEEEEKDNVQITLSLLSPMMKSLTSVKLAQVSKRTIRPPLLVDLFVCGLLELGSLTCSNALLCITSIRNTNKGKVASAALLNSDIKKTLARSGS